VSTKTWVVHHTGIAAKTAGARVTLAGRLRRLPLMAAALSAGLVTSDHARELGRCLSTRTEGAIARDEALLVSTAVALDADAYAQFLVAWLLANDPDGPDPGGERPSELHVSPMLAGRHRLDGDLDLEDSAEVLAELRALCDELYRADQAADDGDPNKRRTHAQRMAAALAEMARRSSAAGDRDDEVSDDDVSDDDAEPPTKTRPSPRRPQIVTVVDIDALAGDTAGLAVLEDGTPLPQAILQRWACDSAIGRVVMTGKSVPIDLGQLTYAASPAQRRALIARDRGCIVPGCKRRARWCDAHHVEPWPGGPTNMANLILLCKRHHKQVHANVIKLEPSSTSGRWIVTRADGTPLKQRRADQRMRVP
jgi:hypothetical protein